MTIDTAATYRLESAAAEAATTRTTILDLSGDIGRHERKLDEHDKDIRVLTESMTMLAASVKFQSRTPFVLSLVSLGLVVIALIGMIALMVVVL